MITFLSPRLIWLPAILLVFLACGSGQGAGKGNIQIKGSINNFKKDSLFVYRIVGNDMQLLSSAPVSKGEFDFMLDVPQEGLYFLGQNASEGTLIVLGKEKEIEISGEGTNFQALTISSPENLTWQKFSKEVYSRSGQIQSKMQELQMAQQMSPQRVQELSAVVGKLTQEQLSFLDSVIAKGGFTGRVARFFKFRPFDAELQAKYGSEVNYYKEVYFSEYDLQDPSLAYIPYFSGNATQFFEALSSNGIKGADLISKYEELKKRMGNQYPENLRVFRLAALAGLSGSNSGSVSNPEAFKHVWADASKSHPKDPEIQKWASRVSQMEAQAKAQASLNEGGTAPDFTLPDVNGKQVKLSDFRGKILLVDFWASWCGPCRMENPNVVKVYNQFKSKGFEILGVSLDRDKAAWVRAIDQDKLTWTHVSDLKYWQCEAAKLYQVTGIPFTLLLDREGKIVAKNLRGPALEAKVKELLN
jgi:peroxiredoxin